MRSRSILIIVSALALLIAVGVIFTLRSRTRAYSMMCAGRLFPMEFAAMFRAEESQSDRYPTDLTYLSNHFATEAVICPSDSSRHAASDWHRPTAQSARVGGSLLLPAVAWLACANSRTIFSRVSETPR